MKKKEICILTATSGDTGKAALEGFKDVPNTRVIVFYPHNGVSQNSIPTVWQRRLATTAMWSQLKDRLMTPKAVSRPSLAISH